MLPQARSPRRGPDDARDVPTVVQNLDLSVIGLLDVRRFQVSVNDALFVRLLECFGHLGGDVESLF